MLEEVQKRCPNSSLSHLFLGNKRISSSSSAQQGDPLASLFFALVLQPLIERIKEECPNLLLLVFFLDDGTIVGRRADLQKVFDILWVYVSTPPSLQFDAGKIFPCILTEPTLFLEEYQELQQPVFNCWGR